MIAKKGLRIHLCGFMCNVQLPVYHHKLPQALCFIFERAKAPRYFPLGKGSPWSKLQASTGLLQGHQGNDKGGNGGNHLCCLCDVSGLLPTRGILSSRVQQLKQIPMSMQNVSIATQTCKDHPLLLNTQLNFSFQVNTQGLSIHCAQNLFSLYSVMQIAG